MIEPTAVEDIIYWTPEDFDGFDGDQEVEDAFVCLTWGTILLNDVSGSLGRRILLEKVGYLQGVCKLGRGRGRGRTKLWCDESERLTMAPAATSRIVVLQFCYTDQHNLQCKTP